MDRPTSTPPIRSAYLRDRLDSRRAESNYSAFSTPHSRPPTSTRKGRDDGIFEDEDDKFESRQKPSLSQTYSPASLPSQDTGGLRRSAPGIGSSVRPMGLREMEEYVNKLSKQNFDLKMELYHRREKHEDLERRIAALVHLEESYSEALQLNEELVSELDKRDIALDEAVIMITQLEADLEYCHDRHRDNHDLSVFAGTPLTKMGNLLSHAYAREDRAADPAARAPPVPRHAEVLHVPSFINSDAPATNTLRSMYMDGDHQIRNIPSYASFKSNANASDGEDDDANMRRSQSPVLSELSESEFRSIYGSPTASKLPERQSQLQGSYRDYDDEPDSPTRYPISETKRLWIAPDERPRYPEPPMKPNPVTRSSAFGSIGGMLGPADGVRAAETSKQSSDMRRSQHKGTPPLTEYPVFGQNIFPPTPDTMLTRPSNASDSSSLHKHNRSQDIRSIGNRLNYEEMFPSMSLQHDRHSNESSSLIDRSSMLPKEVNGHDDDRDRWQQQSRLQTQPTLSHRQNDDTEFISITPNYRQARSSSIARASRPSEALQQQRLPIRRNSIESFSSHVESRQDMPSDLRRELTRSISTIFSPDLPTFSQVHPGVLPVRHQRSISDAGLALRQASAALGERSHAPNSANRVSVMTANDAVTAALSPPKQAQGSLRERVRNLTRNSPLSSEKDAASGARSQSNRRRGSRSESMSRRIFARHGTSDEDFRTNSFKAAATAAAPFLSFDIHKNTASPSKITAQSLAPAKDAAITRSGPQSVLDRPQRNGVSGQPSSSGR